MSYLGLMLDSFVEGSTPEELAKEQQEEEQEEYEQTYSGKSRHTGY